MNLDNWNRIFNHYWDRVSQNHGVVDDSNFWKKTLALCLRPSIDLICRNRVSVHMVIRHIESNGWDCELLNVCEECVDLEKSNQLFLSLVEDVEYIKAKFPIDIDRWKRGYDSDDMPERVWHRNTIQEAIDQYLDLNHRHPLLDRLLIKAYVDFEVCSTMSDITQKDKFSDGHGKSDLEQEDLVRNPKGLRALAPLEGLFWLLLCFASIVFFTTGYEKWGAGVVISVVLFLHLSIQGSVQVPNLLQRKILRPMMPNSTRRSIGSLNDIFEGEKKLYQVAYHPGFISVEQLYAAFEEAAYLGVVIDQGPWALLSDIKSREIILPHADSEDLGRNSYFWLL
jgi:hypothetical protein